ncbi:hypothetical protein L873DRAFT_1393888 [Choiromyces venosus 120613-1]|uniref:Rhodopsin domain-containing protein n=1 Tax=Choiromyces venosus 120613-1 TaxID=1336337 RepID=A0A3N4JCR1_9PEZI|nr:hypothetical protein L873DRAFT_1393888 [Choiromyces venosus 120613-1]
MGDIHLALEAFIALDWALLFLTTIFVVLRIWERTSRRAGPRSVASIASDIFVICSYISAIAFIGINTWKNTLRIKHRGQPNLYYGVPMNLSAHLLKVSWVSLFFIYISLWCAKGGFIAFYFELFNKDADLGRRCKVAGAIVSVITFLTFVLHMLLLQFWCRPVSLNWDINGHLCSAVHSMESVTISTFANVGTDLLIIMLPILVLKNLTFRKSALWGWLFILFIGSISIVAALVRYGALRAVWGQPKASVTHTIDVAAMVEITTSLLAVCSPSLRAFFRGKKNKPHRPSQRDVRDISTNPDLLSTVKSTTDARDSDFDSQKHLSPMPENHLASSGDLPMNSGTSTLTSFPRSV